MDIFRCIDNHKLAGFSIYELICNYSDFNKHITNKLASDKGETRALKRITRNGREAFYPQRKILWFWVSIHHYYNLIPSCESLEHCKDEISEYICFIKDTKIKTMTVVL